MKVSFFIDRPVFSAVLSIVIVIIGIIGLTMLPVDQYPQITPPVVKISASYPGASALTVSQAVATPIEQEINGTPGMLYMESNSSNSGGFSATVTFDVSADADLAAVEIQNRVKLAESRLPAEVIQNGISVEKQAPSQLMTLCLTSSDPKFDEIYLSNFATINVLDVLRRIPGVGRVSNIGSRYYAMQIWAQPDKLANFGLTVQDLQNALKDQNRESAAGVLGQQPVKGLDITIPITTQGRLSTVSQFEDIVVRANSNGSIIRLRDVARVSLEASSYNTESGINGENAAVLGIYMLPGANAIEVADNVKEAMEEISRNFPEGLNYEIPFDMTTYISESIHEVYKTLFEALVLVVLVVFLSLQSWRATLIPIVAVPISLIGTFGFMLIFGFSLNILTLLGLILAIGIVVDDAIVVLENITTHIERGSAPKQAAVHATNEVAISVIASTLTMLAVFLPLTMVTGMAGILFKQLGWIVSIIMIVSTVGALTLTPMLSSLLLRQNPKKGRLYTLFFTPIEKALDALDRGYSSFLYWAVRHRKTVIFGATLIFAGSMLLVPTIKTEFFPTQDNAQISVHIELPVGTRQDITRKLALEIDELFRQKYPEIKTSNFTEGQADSDNTWAQLSNNGTHIIDYYINMLSVGDRERGMVEICEEMRKDLAKYPEIKTFKVIEGGQEEGMGGQNAVDIEIYGFDFGRTDAVAAELAERMRKVKGCSQVNISREDYIPEYQVDFDREKLAINGLNITTAAMALRNRINGSTASKYREDGDEYDIKVRYAPEFRQSVEDIENILVYNNAGQGIRIRDLGKVVERMTPPTIERKDRERVITVSAVVGKGAAMSDIVTAARNQLKEMDIPSDVSWQLGGTYEDQMDTFFDLTILMVLIIILVFIVMAAQFESLTDPFVIMFSIPFAFTGIILGLAITQTPLGVMALIGLIMLMGIVVKNGIVLIDYTILCRERGMGILTAVVTAGKSRLRPVLMTTLTTVLGMIPMAVGTGEGSEMWRSMGMTVAWGLSVSTLITLVIVPVVYSVFAGNGVRRRRRKMAKNGISSKKE